MGVLKHHEQKLIFTMIKIVCVPVSSATAAINITSRILKRIGSRFIFYDGKEDHKQDFLRARETITLFQIVSHFSFILT
jgi:hypothetical protein